MQKVGADNRAKIKFLVVLIGLMQATVVLAAKRDPVETRSNSNWKNIPVNGATPIKVMEEKAGVASVSQSATKMIGSESDGGAWIKVVCIRIMYAHDILEPHERTLGKLAVRSRIEAKGFKFATYREALTYLPEMNSGVDRKYSANILLKAHPTTEGYIQENSIVIRSYRRGKRSVSVRRTDKRFDRHDCFLVVKEVTKAK